MAAAKKQTCGCIGFNIRGASILSMRIDRSHRSEQHCHDFFWRGWIWRSKNAFTRHWPPGCLTRCTATTALVGCRPSPTALRRVRPLPNILIDITMYCRGLVYSTTLSTRPYSRESMHHIAMTCMLPWNTASRCEFPASRHARDNRK